MRNVLIAPSNPGGYDAWYASWNAAENGEDGSMADHLTFHHDAFDDTTAVTVAGWTTNGFSITSQPVSGAGFDGAYSATGLARLYQGTLTNLDLYAFSLQNGSTLEYTIKNLCLEKVSGGNFNYRVAVSALNANNTLRLDGCFVRVHHGAGTGGGGGTPTNRYALESDNASSSVRAINSAIIGASNNQGVVTVAAGSGYLHNCVINGEAGAYGVNRSGGTVEARNTVSFNNATADFQGTITVAYCASDDGTGTNAVTLGGTTQWNAAFTDYANHDYTVKDTSSPLYNAGTDLSGNTNYAVTADVRGTARPQSTSFDIGLHELPAGGGAPSFSGSSSISGAGTVQGTVQKRATATSLSSGAGAQAAAARKSASHASTITGAGAAQSPARKGALFASLVAGAGDQSAAGTKSAASTSAITGGGATSYTASTGQAATGISQMQGAGGVVSAGFKGGRVASNLAGAGVAVSAGRKQGLGSSAIAAAGMCTATWLTARSNTSAIGGGGTLAGVTAKGAQGAGAVSGGGVVMSALSTIQIIIDTYLLRDCSRNSISLHDMSGYALELRDHGRPTFILTDESRSA